MDTSVLTRLGRVEVRREFEPLAATGRLARSTMSDLEIGYSARSAQEWDRLAAALSTLDAVDVSAAQVRRALDVQRLLAQAGLKGRKVPDLVIAAAAEERGVTLLHYDGDFDLISTVTGQRSQWVVPRGSID